MTKKRYPLLKAIKHNWGLIGPGAWTKVKWLIFPDGSYEIVTTFNPSFDAIEKEDMLKPVKKKNTGQMDKKALSKLRKTLKQEPWRDPLIEVHAFDGVAWEMESYLVDGSVDKTSGKLDYIYGYKVLEKIVSLLPSNEGVYDSSAFISVEKKN